MDYSVAFEKNDYSRIDKLNKLTNPDTFWDDVRNLCRRTYSDHSIRRWECLSYQRWEEITRKKKYIANLSAYGNIDHGENPYQQICSGMTITGNTIEEIWTMVRDYIDEHNLGASNISRVYVANNETQEIVGFLSYNGRWNPKGSKYFPNN